MTVASGHVHADLDHRGRHQEAGAAGGEVAQRPFAQLGVELPVRQADQGAEALLQLGEAGFGGGDVGRPRFP
jgi:hypothetical protein